MKPRMRSVRGSALLSVSATLPHEHMILAARAGVAAADAARSKPAKGKAKWKGKAQKSGKKSGKKR